MNNKTYAANRPVDRLIEKLLEFDAEYPEALQVEWLDWLDIVAVGAKKYTLNNWLEADGKNTDNASQMGSLSRHLAQAIYGDWCDRESHLPHILHLICRGQMKYVRDKRDIIHSKDNICDFYKQSI